MAEVLIENLTKTYDETIAVENFSIKIMDGEFLTLLGPSGCGKTTILRCIAGFIPITSGKIYIGEKLVSSISPKVNIPPENRNLGMVFQSYAVWPHMNVWDNIVYPLKVKRLSDKEIKLQAEKTIEMLKLSELGKRFPSELSGGQQQRVALGRAIIMRPDVLLLDEPLSNLDAKLREEMRFELKELQRQIGVTIIYVTHDQSEALTMSDRIIVLSKGKIQQIGTPEEIYDYPENKFVASFIGKANFLNGLIIKGGKKATVKLDSGVQLIADNPNLYPEGKDITIIIRPHNIELNKNKKSNSLEAHIKSKLYLGDRFIYYLDYDGKEVIADSPIVKNFQIGENVFLDILKAAIISSKG